MSQQNTFIYNDLPANQTRLLKISSPHPSLKCELKEHVAATIPEYLALSYTWGSENPTEPVPCGNHILKITPNLYAALCEISLKAEVADKWIWVDAVCINQKNDREKAVEVKRMNEIYTAAWRVLVWLGPAADESDLAMDNLRGLTEIMTPVPTDEKTRQAIEPRLAPKDHPVWTAIVKLYDRSWFRRLWIMQEVILAKGVFVLCGKRVLSWAAIVDFANAISVTYPAVLLQHGERTDDIINGLVSCSQINTLRKKVPNHNLMFFASLLETTRDREATNPLDRIYGLLGIVADDLRKSISVDYTWTASECYMQFCKAFIQREPTLSLLSMAPSKLKAQELPSWCPDLSSLRAETTLYALNAGFKAGFRDWPSRRSRIRVSDNGKTIEVPGFRVDVVRNVVKGHYDMSENKVEMSVAATKDLMWEAECLQLFREVCLTNENGLEAYYRTLIADHFDPTSPVPSTQSLREDYLNLKQFWSELSQSRSSKISTFAAKQSEIRYSKAIDLQKSRKFFNTKGGRVGLGPNSVRSGDVVCIFYSAAPLFVLRFDQGSEKARLIGDAFVNGLMDFNTVPDMTRGTDEWFCLE